MRYAISLLLTVVTAVTALSSRHVKCITDGDAADVATQFANTFSNYSVEYANMVFTSNEADQTDSVAWLINNGTNCPHPLGQTTFPNRTSLELAQATQPNLPFEVLNVWHDCTDVIVRWRFAITPQPAQGISVLGVVKNPNPGAKKQYPYAINHVFSEFNTGAFAVSMGLPIIAKNLTSSAPCPA